jgi:hypothetical protein
MQTNRRDFLWCVAAASTCASLARADEAAGSFVRHSWRRDPANPIFVPGATHDVNGCQGPFVVRHDDAYWMFYGGIDKAGRQRICLATAPTERPTEWKRLGPVIELGDSSTFDELAATYPCVHRFGNLWHLYYTGRSNQGGPQHFANYRGVGLAVSRNLRDWTKHSADPVLTGEGYPGFPDNNVIVGLGRVVELPQGDGRILYRLYHTLPPGLEGKEWHVIENKYAVVAHSFDGVKWFDKRVVLERRRDVPYEDIGVVGLTPWKTRSGWRGIYTGLGTQFHSYALCEASSADGLTWERGKPGENLAIAPAGNGWEKEMIGYPCVVEEGNRLIMFYNGAGGGATGIGMATVTRID